MLQNERPAASSGRRPYQFGNFYPGDKIALFLAHNLNNFKQFQTILNNFQEFERGRELLSNELRKDLRHRFVRLKFLKATF